MQRGLIEAGSAEPAARQLDASQQAVLDLPLDASASVLGAPGTGKTTTLIELIAHRVLHRGLSPDQVLVLAPTRLAATRLRDRLALRLRVPTTGPLARTPASFAFALARRAAVEAGAEPPTLLTGGSQDAILRELLEGHLVDGTGPVWPEQLGEEVRSLRTFRTELRELMMRSTEFRIGPEQLRAAAADHKRPEWVAAADFFDEYLAVVANSTSPQLDPAELMAFATAAVATGGPGDEVSSLRLLVIDDLQEATESILQLITAIAARGVPVIAFGDPDVASNSFRGGTAEAIGALAGRLEDPALRRLTLATVHRHGELLRGLVSNVTDRIGTAAAGPQRRAAARPAPVAAGDADAGGVVPHGRRPEPVLVVEAATPARQYATLAREFREQHLLGGVPWGEMAVVVRSGALVPAIAKAFALAEIPTRTSLSGRPVREDPAARALLSLLEVALGRADLTPERAADLLLSPFGRLDRLSLRKLRLALRQEELAGAGTRSSDALLVEALDAPGRVATIDSRFGRAAASMAALLDRVRAADRDGATIEELLWLVWERSRLAEPWFKEATAAGVTAAEANRNLDGVLALFTSARDFVERRPGDDPRLFLEALLDAEVPDDTLTPRSHDDSVLVTTPSGVVGSEFEVVAVAGLQEGVWPNLRLRGSLLGPGALVRIATGLSDAPIDERRQVLDDELRMFALAVSRARNRVVLSAVVNDDESRSMFLSLAPEGAGMLDSANVLPLSLRGLTGRLRRELTARHVPEPARAAAASGLARLAAEALPGADPVDWHGMLPPSSDDPLFDLDDADVRVPVSPSKLERFEESPLNWFIDLVAGDSPSVAMSIGNVVHWAMESATGTDPEQLWSAVEGRWDELVFEAEWLGAQQRRIARRMIDAVAQYLKDFEAEGGRLVSAEGSFKLEVDRAVVRGKIDRVEQASDGRVIIVDLKTGTYNLTAAQLKDYAQLSAYQLAYADGGLDGLGEDHRPGGAKLLYVKKGVKAKPYREAPQPAFGAEEHDAFRERIRRAATAMAASGFEGLLEVDEYKPGEARFRWHVVKAVSSD
ncbi:ATP-dependent helicase [Lysobacter korlensis]|uniref:DNA 3'-5' helicase n=1 Tax=Lysobacter korlensis TaxID=553636 RepID=A0ABV6RZ29_9GAMM